MTLNSDNRKANLPFFIISLAAHPNSKNPIQLMRAILSKLSCIVLICTVFTGCKEEIEDLQLEPLTDYLSLQPGKYIIYRLDSTVFTQSGRVQEIHSYQEKVVIDKEITDNMGRPGYRLYRFLRDAGGQNPWTSSGSFFITPTTGGTEIIEDNLRVLKMILPIKEGETWKGNRFLATSPYSIFEFSDDNHIHLEDWEFSYSATGETVTLNNKTIPDVITVQGPDEAVNAAITDPKSFGSRTFLVDKYAKNIGLVYQELILWEYQPNPGSSPFRVGFGIKRSMIDHN